MKRVRGARLQVVTPGPRMVSVFFAAAVALPAALAGCSRSSSDGSPAGGGLLCPAVLLYTPGIVVEVRDKATNDPIATDAIGTLQDETYTETMQPYKPAQSSALLSLQGAIERAGTYDVLVQKPGYNDWKMNHVTVLMAGCDIATVYLMADMERTN